MQRVDLSRKHASDAYVLSGATSQLNQELAARQTRQIPVVVVVVTGDPGSQSVCARRPS
jgi:hypothetical protein